MPLPGKNSAAVFIRRIKYFRELFSRRDIFTQGGKYYSVINVFKIIPTHLQINHRKVRYIKWLLFQW